MVLIIKNNDMKDLSNYFSKNLAGKKALITGGSTGIGREITLLLTQLGVNCLICGREQQPIEETASAVEQSNSPGLCQGMTADVSNIEDINKLFVQLDRLPGNFEILINNAALGYGSVMEGSHPDWDYIVKTNLTAYLTCSHFAVERFKMNGSGHIVNIGSMSADVREEGSSVYVATKAGIQGFSEALRKELNPEKIRVTLIEPGAVDTDMQPGSSDDKQHQLQELEMLPAEDIAIAVAFCIAQPERSNIVNLQIKPLLQII